MEDSVHLCNVQLRDEQWVKEKAAAQATLACIAQQKQIEEAAWKKEEKWQSKRSQQCEAQQKLAKEGAAISNVMPLGPVMTLSPTHWVGVSTLGPGKTSMKCWDGLTSGAPALWTTNS